jgi:hypothetical protein
VQIATFKDDGYSAFKEVTRDGFGELIVRRRVKPENLQSLQCVHRGRPGLPRLTAGIARREARAAVPEPVGTLEREETRTPAVMLQPGSLSRHVAGRRVREIAQHLPAEGGVAVE